MAQAEGGGALHSCPGSLTTSRLPPSEAHDGTPSARNTSQRPQCPRGARPCACDLAVHETYAADGGGDEGCASGTVDAQACAAGPMGRHERARAVYPDSEC